jgi:DNA-binding NarL/FixJ family response regulator
VLYGRAAERAALDAVLDDARRGRSRCLVLRGEVGVGKTALLAYAVEQAADLQVLRATGAAAESSLAFAGLHQLLRAELGRLGGLPDVQAAALATALGLAAGTAPDRFLVGVAVLSLLSEVAADAPLLCVVDDAHWLDSESVDALAFAARRLEAEGVAMLLATTDASGSLTNADLPVLTVVGLDRAGSDALLEARCPRPPAPQVCASLWRLTSGSPLALLEVSAALTRSQLSGEQPLPEDVALGVALQHTMLARTRTLPETTQTLLLVAAAEGTGDLGLILRAAARLGADPAALDPAEAAGLVTVADGRIEFRDPLMRTAVYQAAPFGRRLTVHATLADCLSGDAVADRRAWHRAAATVGADDDVALELEQSATRARARGGYAAAATTLERAADLTSDAATAGQRLVGAANDAWTAGRADVTLRLLDRATPLVSHPLVRGELDLQRGVVEAATGDRRAAFDLLAVGAEPLMELDHARAARLLVEAGRVAWSDADLPAALSVSQRMQRLTLEPNSRESYAVRVMAGLGSLLQGDTTAAAPLLRAVVADADREDPEQLQYAGAAAMVTGDESTAVELLTRAMGRARALGAVSRLPETLATLASLQSWGGDLSTARSLAAEGAALARETGQEHFAAHLDAVLAWVAAVQGREQECTELAGAAVELGLAHRVRPPVALATWALALSDLGAGRWADATIRLEAVASPHSDQSHPVVAALASSDLVEAATWADRPKAAAAALARLEEFARPAAVPWPRALVARCRALVSNEDPTDLYEEAIAGQANSTRRFDEARTRLLYGEHLRRAKRRREARDQLRTALEAFERMSATPWEGRARAELRATGVTVRRRQEPEGLTQLTPQQNQIARLVAEGASNKEVAAQLFLSTRTVDYHLRNVFIKLGITSRAELARIVAPQ